MSSIETRGVPLKGVGKSIIRGQVLKWDGAISFLGDVDPEKGILTKGDLSESVKDMILVFREGAGSTVGSYVVYNLRIHDNSPLAMVMVKADAIITIGCILADIPLINRFDQKIMDLVSSGDEMEIDPQTGIVRLIERQDP